MYKNECNKNTTFQVDRKSGFTMFNEKKCDLLQAKSEMPLLTMLLINKRGDPTRETIFFN